MNVIVKQDGDYPAAKIIFGDKEFKAVVGRNGVTSLEQKAEGDGKTPIGGFNVLAVYYRPDKIKKPKSVFPTFEITTDDMWVDESGHQLYNQPAHEIDVKGGVSHEELYREDHLYDVFLDLDYNRNPAVPGKGSAIFMHVARDEDNPSNTPTAGCIALKKEELLAMLEDMTLDSSVIIEG